MASMRILLVEDQALFRKGVAGLLESRPGIEVVGEAENGFEAVIKALETMPDVILMDISMPQCDGLEATLRIKREMPHVKIIMLTVSDDDRRLFTAIKNGADGYILKNIQPYQLFDMLEGINRGEAPFSGIMAAKIIQEFRQPGEGSHLSNDLGTLTPREVEVLTLVAEGATNAEIAEKLCIEITTVKNHLCNILEKLHLRNRIQAAVYAVRQGIVNSQDDCD
jgi:two-component system nitrate/nitrite response regulator NarL